MKRISFYSSRIASKEFAENLIKIQEPGIAGRFLKQNSVPELAKSDLTFFYTLPK
jgi:hypothetical protein